MTDEWYVLIEEDTRESRRVEGIDLKLHRWCLVGTHRVDGDEARAAAAAEDAALRYVPERLARHAQAGDEPGRRAFLAPDGAWLVHLEQRHRACHIRVTTARLVHVRKEEQAPPKSLREKFRHALDGPPPSPDPWAPPDRT